MIVGFKFMTPTDKGQFTMMTPNLLLAHSDAVKTKRDKISIWLAILLIFTVLFVGNVTEFTGVLQGPKWFIVLLISTCVSFSVFLYGIIWSGPRAALLCAVMGTENFEEYLQKQLALLSEMLRPENIKLMRLRYRTVKHLQKVVVSMEILLEVYNELKDAEDLYSEVDFLRDYTSLYGFEFKDITKEVVKSKKQ